MTGAKALIPADHDQAAANVLDILFKIFHGRKRKSLAGNVVKDDSAVIKKAMGGTRQIFNFFVYNIETLTAQSLGEMAYFTFFIG